MIERDTLFDEANAAVEMGDRRYERALCHSAALLKENGNLPKAIEEFKDILHRDPRQIEIDTIKKWGGQS